jgi:YVTN family beta-propeller protein
VANCGNGTVVPIDTATNTTETPIKVGRCPGYIAITPNGRTAYVANEYFFTKIVTPINLATNTAGAPIRVGFNPHWIAITPDGKTAYVACFNVNVPPGQLGVGTIVPISTATEAVGKPVVTMQADPSSIAITPDGATAYVSGGLGVVVIDTASNTVAKLIPAGIGPYALAITTNGATVYVADDGTGSLPSDTVIPIDTASNTAEKAIRVGLGPVAIALTH